MVATQHSRSGARAHDGGRSAEIAAVERLLGQAADFELRAPELALVLGERAAALAEGAGAEQLWVRGEGLAVSARVRLGLRAPTVGRAVAALRAAEDAGQTALAAQLRTDLAVCARSVGAPLTGLAALRPVLDTPEFGGARKAAALSQLVGCLSQFGRKPELDRTLAEADRLCGADNDLDGDGRLLARSLLRVAVSAHRRRHGDVIGAADAARTGLGFLEQVEDAQRDGGVVRIRLVLQLVCSLLDRGDGTNALDIAQPVLDTPARAASVAPAGWLRMAIATRVLLPAGSVEAAARMLRDAVHATERHDLRALTARLWTELAHVEERLGRYAEAIECLQLARAAEHVHARARRQAVGLLTGEFGGGGHAEVDLDHVLGSVPASTDATASVAVAPLSVPEWKVPESREPSSEVKTEKADAPRPREAAEQAGKAARADSGRPVRSLAPEPADERSAEVAQASPFEEPGKASRPAHFREGDGTPQGEPSEESGRAPRSHRSDEVGTTPLVELPGGSGRASRSDRSDEVGATPRVEAGEESRGPSRSERSDEAGSMPRAETAEESGRAPRSTGAESETSGTGHRVERAVEATSSQTDGGRRRAEPAPVSSRLDEPSGRHADGAAASSDRLVEVVAPGRRPGEPSAGRRRADERSESGASASGEDHAESRASRKTRHDSEHGSVAARSVLDRLGISTGATGATGGRRRAPGAGEPGLPDSGGRRRGEEDVSAEFASQGAGPEPDERDGATSAGYETTSRGLGDRPADSGDSTARDEAGRVHGLAGSGRSAGTNRERATLDESPRESDGREDSDRGSATAREPASVDEASRESGARENASRKDMGSTGESWLSADAEPVSRADISPSRQDKAAELEETVRGENGPAPSMPVIENWLPRLRLPPSLAPWDDFAETDTQTSSGTSETPFTNAPVLRDDGLGEPFRSELSGVPDDDLPEDAGLADLLARALAEHQAGTASAAALVKRLGNQSASEPRPVNGHGRNGTETGNGRHRGDG